MPAFLSFTLLFGILFLVIDWLQKKIWKNFFWARKATHILSGFVCFFLPDYLNAMQIAELGLLFAIVLGISKWKKILLLHNVKRKTFGEILYPVSLGLLALFVLPENPLTFKLAVLILSLGDGFAELAGEKLKWVPLHIFGNKKSLGGSLTFFVISFIVWIAFRHENSIELAKCIIGALLVTLVEILLTFGFDNLAIPLATALLDILLFG